MHEHNDKRILTRPATLDLHLDSVLGKYAEGDEQTTATESDAEYGMTSAIPAHDARSAAASRASLGLAKRFIGRTSHVAPSGIADNRGDGSMSSSGGHLLIGERLARRLEGFAWVSIVGTVYFVLAVTALHFLRPDYNPTTRFVSEFAVGPYGFLMTTAFFALGFGSPALALGIRRGVAPSRAKSAGSLVLGIFAIGILVSGIFPTDLQGSPETTAGAIHANAGWTVFVTIVAAIFLSSRGFRRDPAWSSYHATSLALGFAALVTLLLLFVSFKAGWQGIGQRAFLAVFLLWLLSTENRLRSAARAKVPTE